MTNLQKFVKDFISIARKKKGASKFPLELFSSPCQITVIYIKKNYLMIMLAKHDPEGVDKEVYAHTVNKQKISHLVDKKYLWIHIGSNKGMVLK